MFLNVDSGACQILESKYVFDIVPTLFSKASDTSKTFVVPKRLILRNPGWLRLKAHKLPFFHVKF